jgi:hypothetical protein
LKPVYDLIFCRQAAEISLKHELIPFFSCNEKSVRAESGHLVSGNHGDRNARRGASLSQRKAAASVVSYRDARQAGDFQPGASFKRVQ